LALVELSIVEQRYRAVLDVNAGRPVTEVAAELGVSRQTLHTWLARYRQDGVGGLVNRPRRPESCPHQSVAALISWGKGLRRRVRPPTVIAACGHSDGYRAGTRADLGTSRLAGRRTALSR
jgi:hypothetical protein